jgi:hypothetical protein
VEHYETLGPLVEEETLLQGGTIETSDVEFKDTFFFADVNDHCVHSDGHSGGRHFLINTSCFMK